MKRTTIAAIFLCTALTGLVGCGQQAQSASSSANTQAAASDSTQSSKTVTGRITIISGSTITLETMGGGMQGQPPAQGDQAQGGAASKDSSASANTGNTAPGDGGQPQGGGGPGNGGGQPQGSNSSAQPQGSGAASSETVSVTLTDKCEVVTEANGKETAASTSDLKVGDNVKISYASDGETVDSVVILSDQQKGQGSAAGATNGTAAAGSANTTTGSGSGNTTK